MIAFRRLHHRFLPALILTLLCHCGLSQTIYSGFVWCFGADGHIAMEPAGHHHAAELNDHTEHPADGLQSVASNDDSLCTDIPPSNTGQLCHSESDKDLFKLVSTDLSYTLGVLLFLLPCIVRQGFRSIFNDERPIIDPARLALRSTVLLI